MMTEEPFIGLTEESFDEALEDFRRWCKEGNPYSPDKVEKIILPAKAYYSFMELRARFKEKGIVWPFEIQE
jgi:hypothetical protein